MTQLHVQLNIVSPCVVVCLKFIKTQTFCNLLLKFFVSQSHLEDDGSDAPRLLHRWHFFVRH